MDVMDIFASIEEGTSLPIKEKKKRMDIITLHPVGFQLIH